MFSMLLMTFHTHVIRAMRGIDDMICAHYPFQDKEDFLTALYGTSLRTLVDIHMRNCHTD